MTRPIIKPTTKATTANLNFAKDPEQHQEYLDHLTGLLPEPGDLLLVQEAKKIRLRDMLPPTWGTMQRTRTASTRGTAVNWHKPLTVRRSRLKLGALPIRGRRVARMLPRRIAVLDCDVAGVRTSVLVPHYPPLRYRFLWPQMDRRLARLVKRKIADGCEVLIGADFNTHPAAVANRLLARGVKLHAVSDGHIDGFLHTDGLVLSAPVVSRYGMQHGLTDHPSVTVTITPKEKP